MPLDYTSWKIEQIDADRADMPLHIKAIKADYLSPEALARADEMFRRDFRTQSVQIEMVVPLELRSFANHFRNSDMFTCAEDDLALPADKMEYTRETPATIEERLNERFKKWAQAAAENQQNLARLEQWKKMLTDMPRAAGIVWPNAFTGLETWQRGTTKTKEAMHFHTHPMYKTFLPPNNYEFNYPGFFLNFAQAKTGTVFKDDVSKTLWVGKAWSYNLFSTEGHKNIIACDHSVPDARVSGGDMEERFTDILQIYPHKAHDFPNPY